MCGINGIAIPKQLNRRVSESRLVAMRDALIHRGPASLFFLAPNSSGC
jgi:asparagine synthetase B (glutamine-hydrolysing)